MSTFSEQIARRRYLLYFKIVKFSLEFLLFFPVQSYLFTILENEIDFLSFGLQNR